MRKINGNPAAFSTYLKSAEKLDRNGAKVWPFVRILEPFELFARTRIVGLRA